jgi:hypothetical protein
MRRIAVQKEADEVAKREFVPYLREEALKGWKLYKDGIIREMYFKTEHPDAVLILECSSVEHAKEKLNRLPLVQKGLISFDLIPLCPYHGYKRLFDKEYLD